MVVAVLKVIKEKGEGSWSSKGLSGGGVSPWEPSWEWAWELASKAFARVGVGGSKARIW